MMTCAGPFVTGGDPLTDPHAMDRLLGRTPMTGTKQGTAPPVDAPKRWKAEQFPELAKKRWST